MNIGVQTIDVINALGKLNPTDVNLENPQLDPSQLIPTFPIDAGWVGMEYFALASNSITLNGARVDMEDTDASDWSTALPPGSSFDIQKSRALMLQTHILGGTTSPLRVQFSWFAPGIGGFDFWSGSVVNPGDVNALVLVPAGFSFRVRVAAAGAGDTVTNSICGWQAPPGVPVPFTSPYVTVMPNV